jgi:hypothetical protein
MTPEQMENGRIGVELMTAWSAGDKSNDFYTQRVQLLVDENWQHGNNGRLGLLKALVGLGNVAGLLLVWLSQQTGHIEEEVLQEVARHFHPRD